MERLSGFVKILLLLLPIMIPAGWAYGENIEIGVKGSGVSVSHDIPSETQRQEAFVTAFFEGVRNIAEEVAQLSNKKIAKGIPIIKDGKLIRESILSSVREKIADFDLDSITLVENYVVKDDL